MTSEAVSPGARNDPQSAIDGLEAQLAATPRALRPYEHAAVAYRLGLAYAESPSGSRGELLRKALACFDVAAAIFDVRFDPVEHARVLNAAGACHRALGDRRKAAELFERAAALLDGRDRDDERAAALNNLGLARTELGQPEAAVEAFDVAAGLFDTTTPDGRRGRVATLHNRGQAHAALGTEDGLGAALADYEEAQDDLDADEAPYHHGLVHHSIGAALSALATRRPGERRRLLEEAVAAFTESLTVFARSSFPYQYALAKHNLGLAHAGIAEELAGEPGRGGRTRVQYLRRALACFEEAVAVLDTRIHSDAWKQAYASLSRVEAALEPDAPGATRPDHFAALAGAVPEDERRALLRERLMRLLALPEPRRSASLAELAVACARSGADSAQLILEAELDLLMELPGEVQDVALRARYAAHQQLAGEERDTADRALDAAIGAVLGAPQRIFVRDFLYSLGWERP